MVHEQNQRPSLGRGKPQARRCSLGEKRARLRVWTRAHRAAGVVKEEREIKDKRVREVFKQPPVGAKFWILRLHHGVEFVDANQGVFVGCVTMEKFVLHQAGELSKFRNVSAEKIDPVHHAQDAAHLAFP